MLKKYGTSFQNSELKRQWKEKTSTKQYAMQKDKPWTRISNKQVIGIMHL